MSNIYRDKVSANEKLGALSAISLCIGVVMFMLAPMVHEGTGMSGDAAAIYYSVDFGTFIAGLSGLIIAGVTNPERE